MGHNLVKEGFTMRKVGVLKSSGQRCKRDRRAIVVDSLEISLPMTRNNTCNSSEKRKRGRHAHYHVHVG
ncbi:hypothetical protein MUK42_34512 [Musa troglodytarum]|uniref:Uncharacterized protein n=1 Tax=Musa troglodytarum TaxID=320322 RepID=A0A9E7JA56_9LILI|nr:hypothetical protein MUK42_34512 [Musa troglodytarum]